MPSWSSRLRALAKKPVNWLKTSARWPLPMMSPSCSTSAPSLAQGSASWRLSTSPGCRLSWRSSAATDAAAATAPAAGPCPRSELFFDDELGERADRRGRVAVLLRCVAAAAPGCRGTVRLLDDSGGRAVAASTVARFQIPAGQRRRLAVRLTRRGRALVGRDGGDLLTLSTTAVAADGAARRHRRLEQPLRASAPDQPAPHRRPRRGRLEVA